MRYPKQSPEYEVNLEAYREMREYVPMTKSEVHRLSSWVKAGYDLDTNPWNYFHENGEPLCFLEAYRLEYGYSSGPWDNWRGRDGYSVFHADDAVFILKNYD